MAHNGYSQEREEGHPKTGDSTLLALVVVNAIREGIGSCTLGRRIETGNGASKEPKRVIVEHPDSLQRLLGLDGNSFAHVTSAVEG